MVPVMAQILLWERAEMNVSLGNIKPKEFFFFEQGRIGLKPGYNSLESRVQHAASQVAAAKAEKSEIAAAEVEFRAKQGLEKYIRGKYLLWFFIECGKEIHLAISCFCSKYRVPPGARFGLGCKNAIVVIAPRVRCPTSLRMFLERNYGAYISEMSFAG